jgi:hypothetical protein
MIEILTPRKLSGRIINGYLLLIEPLGENEIPFYRFFAWQLLKEADFPVLGGPSVRVGFGLTVSVSNRPGILAAAFRARS